MYKLLSVLVCITYFHSTNAQSASQVILGNGTLQAQNSMYYPVALVNRQGQRINGEIDITAEGNPYYVNEWHKATITTFEGVILTADNIKMHLQANKVYYKKNEKEIIELSDGQIRELTFNDVQEGKVTFACGYAAIDKNTVNTYYKVLSSGTYNLLCYIDKPLVETKNQYSGEKRTAFETYTAYYMVINGVIKAFNPKKDVKNIEKYILTADKKIHENFMKTTTVKDITTAAALLNYINNYN